jgi:hypothetical protein
LTYIYVNIFANIYVEYNTEHLKEIEERFTTKLDVLETDYKRQINALTEQIEAQVCTYIYIYIHICMHIQIHEYLNHEYMNFCVYVYLCINTFTYFYYKKKIDALIEQIEA